jgi:dipeptidyl aminopeptidase/acylaminoacyl peptidase
MPAGIDALLGDLDDWARRSPHRPAGHAYGSDPEQVAELRLPAGPGPHPVAVLLHGGFWRARFSARLTAALACDLTDRGWASWNAEYRRAGNGGGPIETLDDVAAAIAALRGLDAPLDLDRVVVIGHSAGGQLGLCAAAAAPVRVRCVVALAPICDLVATARDGLGEDAAVAWVGATAEQAPELYAHADPSAHLPTGVDSLLVHGDADQRVPIAQSRAYQAAARAAGDRCELLELPGADHFAPILPWSDAWAAVAARLPGLG